MPPKKHTHNTNQPTVYRAGFKALEVFSFKAEPVDTSDTEEGDLCRKFNSFRDEYNRLTKFKAQVSDLPKVVEMLECKYNMLFVVFEEKRQGRLKDLLRDLLVGCFYYKVVNNKPNITKMVELFDRTHQKLSVSLDQEIVWYWFVVELTFHSSYNSSAIARTHLHSMLENVKHIKSQQHRDYLYCALKRRLDAIEDYPKIELYTEFQKVFPERPWPVDGECASKRHDFVLKRLTNKRFFGLEQEPNEEAGSGGYLWSVERLNKTGVQRCLALNAEDCITGKVLTVELTISPYSLAKFSAHIYPPLPPTLLLEIPGMDQHVLGVINFSAIQKLRALKLCDSDGSINVRSFNLENFPRYCNAIIEACREEISDESALAAIREKLVEDRGKYIERHEYIEKLRNNPDPSSYRSLSGFFYQRSFGI